MRKYIDDTIKRDFLNIAETSKINTITGTPCFFESARVCTGTQ